MPIQILDLKAEYKSLKQEIDQAVLDVLESGAFILGPNVSALEKEIAAYVGTKHALAVASGTDALFLSLKALGIKEGDEVILPTLTFIATAEAVSYTGAKPVFVDSDPVTHNIDISGIEKAMTKKTKAIMPVHLWGLPADMDEVAAVAKKHGLKVVEDCAQAIGASYNGKKTGSFGDAAGFSFFPTKNLGAYGDAGIITTSDDEVYEKLKLLHLHGSKSRGVHEVIGYNSRLDEIQAAILRIKLRHIDRWNDDRRRHAAIYNEMFGGSSIKSPCEPKGCRHVYHQYTIELADREKVREGLAKEGITSFVYYPNPVHIQQAYQDLGYKTGDFPVSEKIGASMLSLPVYPQLPDTDVKKVAAAVLKLTE